MADDKAPDSKTIAKDVVEEFLVDVRYQNMLKGLLSEVMDEKLTVVNNRLDKLEKRCEAIEERCDRDSGEVFDLKQESDSQRRNHNDLESRFEKLENRVHYAEVALCDIQQYTRRNCLLITGIPESNKKDDNGKFVHEDTDKVIIELAKNELELDIRPEDIDRSHRATRARNEPDRKPRAIVAKFTTYNTRDKVIKARRRLKGKGIGIQELLTHSRQSIFNHAQQAVKDVPRFMNTWTWDGNVSILIDIDEKGTGKRFNANSKWDVDNLANLYGNYHHDDGSKDTEKNARKTAEKAIKGRKTGKNKDQTK